MTWTNVSHKSKDDAFGVNTYNILVDDLNYLKTQSEVTVAANGTTVKSDVIPEAALTVSNSPADGCRLTANSTAGGGLTWENQLEDEFYWIGGR